MSMPPQWHAITDGAPEPGTWCWVWDGQAVLFPNIGYKQQLAAAMDQTKRLEEKITSAMSRLEGLLSQMPAEDEA